MRRNGIKECKTKRVEAMCFRDKVVNATQPPKPVNKRNSSSFKRPLSHVWEGSLFGGPLGKEEICPCPAKMLHQLPVRRTGCSMP